jgi:hypothetical protein
VGEQRPQPLGLVGQEPVAGPAVTGELLAGQGPKAVAQRRGW